MPLDELILLMERFVSGEAMSSADAALLEGALLENSALDPSLEALADDFAQYSPRGGEFLFDFARMKQRVEHHLSALRASVSP